MAEPFTIGMAALGTLASTVGAVAQGQAQAKAAEFEAEQLEQQAQAARAAGTRRAAEEHRQKRLMSSRAQAVGASSGGGRAFEIEGDIEQEGTYRALTAIWEGNEIGAGRSMQARARRYDAKAARRAGYVSAFGNFTSGAADTMGLARKYGWFS